MTYEQSYDLGMAMIDLRSTDSSDPGGYADPLAVIGAALVDVAAESRDGWSGPGISGRVRELVDVSLRVEVEAVRALAQWDAAALYGTDGYLSAQAWLVREGGLASGVAQKLLGVARLCQGFDAVAELFYASVLSMAKAAGLARVVTADRALLFARDVHKVLDAIVPMNADDAQRIIGYWSRCADDELGIEPADAYAKRHLHISQTFGGMVVLDALLDPEAGAVVLAALEALDHPDTIDGETMPRTAAQRRADNMVEMARRSLASDGHLDPDKTVNVVIDAELVLGDETDVACDTSCDGDCDGHSPRMRSAGELLAISAGLLRRCASRNDRDS